MDEKALMQRFVDGWKKGLADEILDALSDDCIIIESHGPTYRGKESVKRWIADWFGEGNVVEKWVIKSFHTCHDCVVFEWVFAYHGKDIREAFEGITIAKVKDGRITDLREYRSTAFPYMKYV
jgi:ketosteroid isomerase-like protein